MKAVVIGAGIAGLATAGLLARHGYEVTVVEKNGEVGGRAARVSLGDFVFESGPSWYLMPEAYDHFFEIMGTSTDKELYLVTLDPGYRVIVPGDEPADVPRGTDAVAEFFESREPGAGAAVREYLERAAEVYQLALDRFLYTTFSTPQPFLNMQVIRLFPQLLRWLAQPLGSYVDQRFKDPVLRKLLQYPAVFLSGQPATVPSLYHLMSHTDLTLGVQYPMGGFTTIVDALERLARAYGASIRVNTEVTAITANTKRHVTGVSIVDAAGHPGRLAADIVVSTADLHHTETALLPKRLRTYPERYFARRNPGVSAIVLLLGVRGTIDEIPHHTLLLSPDWDADFRAVFDSPEPLRPEGASRSMYVCRASATDPAAAPAGSENLFVLIPAPADPSLGTGNAFGAHQSPQIAAIADAAIEEIAEWAHIPDLRERIVEQATIGPGDYAARYNSWAGSAIGPAHTLRQSAFLRGRNASRKVRGLYYAGGTTVPGVGVPMCLISAENVLLRLAEE